MAIKAPKSVMKTIKGSRSTNRSNVTKNHAALHEFVGDWALSQKIWPRPGAKPIEVKGKTRCVEILGGVATMMTTEVKETNFKGVAIITYNNEQGQYDLAWFASDAENGMMRMHGRPSGAASRRELRSAFGSGAIEARTWDASAQAAIECLPGDMGGQLLTVAQGGNADLNVSRSDLGSAATTHELGGLRMVENKVDDDHWVLEFFMAGPQGEFLVQQNNFTRAKRRLSGKGATMERD